VRRIGAAIFLLFYTAFVLTMSVQRTDTSANELAYILKHLRANQESGIDEARKHPPRQVHARLFEDHSVLISSFISSFAPPFVQTPVFRLEGFAIGHGGRTVSPRAPPALL
jgi:hypothetical protein